MILAIVSSGTDFHRDVRQALDGCTRFEKIWDLGFAEADRLRNLAPDLQCVVVIDFSNLGQGLAVARAVSGNGQLAAVAVGAGDSKDELLRLMQAGVREVLPGLGRREAQQAVSRAAGLLSTCGEAVGDLYTFVPAKPGCGASTVATYTTAVAARLAEQPTLLLDFDVRLGVTSFLLKGQGGGGHTIVDGLAQADRLDSDIWSSIICERGNLHLLGSGPVDFSQTISTSRYTQLLDFALRRYPAVSVDLPGSMEEYERDALMRSKRIFLVCTPDISGLHVARRKVSWLKDLLLTDRVSVVLNRFERRSTLSVSAIEQIIQLPVRYILPEGAHEIARAVERGVALEGSSSLAKQIQNLAADIAPSRPAGRKPNPVRRFVEYFSVSVAREKQAEHLTGSVQGD